MKNLSLCNVAYVNNFCGIERKNLLYTNNVITFASYKVGSINSKATEIEATDNNEFIY